MSDHHEVASIGIDPDAFEAFYREHLNAVQRFVARRVDDPHTAADLTADIFVAVIESADSYNASLGPPRAWLFGIARNVISTEWRGRARGASATAKLGGRRVLQSDALERALERIDAEESARELYGRIQRLEPNLRAVLELVALDELTVADAASILRITPGAARVRLHRARRQVLDVPTATPATTGRER
ncbi:MAG: sigma-70 family RNA polymerase sigma factor [Nocardioides sp.]